MKMKLQKEFIYKLRPIVCLAVWQICSLHVLFGRDISHQGIENTKVSISLKDEFLVRIFTEIESQTDFVFVYDEQVIDNQDKFSLEFKDASVADVLKELSRQGGLQFKPINNNITVRRRYDRSSSFHKTISEKIISGVVKDAASGEPLPFVNVSIRGTTDGTVSAVDGTYSLSIPEGEYEIIFSFTGYMTKTVIVSNETVINISMEEDPILLDGVVVIGYGTQKKSDITGAVASMPKDRLEMVPNINIGQALQGSVAGVMVNQSTAGAVPAQSIMIRGRNSILAGNEPLIVLDGVPYVGQISDININNIESIEVLKDASSTAIYGSRGSNGVILITTKTGADDKLQITYDGYYSIQDFTKLPDLMNGEEFYQYKLVRDPGNISDGETEIYESGEWVDWADLALRKGHSTQHSLAVSGGLKNVKYYISGNYLGVQGLVINDSYERITGRINVDVQVTDWLSVGTRTQITSADKSGASPSLGSGIQGANIFDFNPLSRVYDDNGDLIIYPQYWDTYFPNPLAPTLFENIDRSYQVVSNNFAVVDFPFITGLSYRINTGITKIFSNEGTYRGRNTKQGLEAEGQSETERAEESSTVIENILSYKRDFGLHNVFATALYSFQENSRNSNSVNAQRFPNDFLTWYSAAQAEIVIPGYSYNRSILLSQMLRLNYSYNDKYLLTLTGRRDGYSGFGENSKWGLFPSVALGWNLGNEDFFPYKELFSYLKIRTSYGLNGNQGVNAYQTIARLEEYNIVAQKKTYPGYRPGTLGIDNLGWESSRTLNVGLDFGLFQDRIEGSLNLYRTNTFDLLLNRTISGVHGITSIAQNIGETKSHGIEVSIESRNIVKDNFKWSTNVNMNYDRNEIVSLYGSLDEQGNEIDDVANSWFIGQPISANYHWVWDGVWQTDEAELAQTFASEPGFVKVKDINGDQKITADDRQIIGQRDPKFFWGMTNTFEYDNFQLSVFMHGVHGVTRVNQLMRDNGLQGVRDATTNKNWWTPENPTNEWIKNDYDAQRVNGTSINYFEDASFVRVKDISLSYNFPQGLIGKFGIDRFRVFVTGRNLFTITKWRGLDPELESQRAAPLQNEYVFGFNLGF